MSRTFLCPDLPDHGPALLPAAESRHLATVLRTKAGEEVSVADGRGRTGRARYEGMEGPRARLTVLSVSRVAPPPAGRIAIASAIPKGTRADWMIEKCVEAGADVIFPLLTRRTVVTAEGASKRARWDRIASEASKQCGRATLPEIHEPRALAEVLELTAGWPVRVVADAAGAKEALPSGDAIAFIGPEGGFAPEEMNAMKALPRIALGPHILRVETAAVLALGRLTAR